MGGKSEKYQTELNPIPFVLHDINNSLSNLFLNLQFMQNSKQFDEFAVNESITNLVEIQNIISSSKQYLYSSAGREFFNPSIQVDKVVRIMRMKLESVEVITDVDDCRIKGDSVIFRQIIFNLLLNSVEAMIGWRKKGKVQINSFVSDDQVLISIEDNGKGIKRKDRQQIFKVGFSTREKFAGGLGLAFVYLNMTKLFTGKIKVTSKWRKGTKVELYFPKPADIS